MAETPQDKRANRAAAHSGGARPPGEAPAARAGAVLAVIAVLLAGVTAISVAVTLGLGDGGPRFRMTDQTGRAVDQGVLRGRWSAVFFGYVNCPDVCPATMQTLGAAQAKLGPDAARFQVVFVSVDPRRDTPAVLKAYLSQEGFPAHAVGLTGTPAQVAAMAQAYRAPYAYTPRPAAEGGGYDVSHSAAIYLADPKGRTTNLLFEQMGPDSLAAQVRKAMRPGG
jgi:protein SCO1/2